MIEVDLPDGNIAEFEDGTSPDVIKAALQKRFPPTPERPAKATQVIHGLNEAFYKPVTAAEDIIAGMIGSEKRPVGAFLKKYQYPSDAVTPGERVARSAGAMVPETALMAAGLSLGVPALPAGLARPVMGVRDFIAQSMFKPYQTATPAITATGDLTGALGAGAGMQAYKELSDGPTGIGEAAAGLAGGALGAGAPAVGAAYSRYSPFSVATRVMRNALVENMPDELGDKVAALGALRDSRREAIRERELPRVAKEFGGLRQPEMQEGLARANQLREEVPGFDPSLAESTGLPSAVAAQKTIERGASGADLDALARRRALSEEALRRYQEGATPQAQDAERAVSGAMERRVADVRGAHEGQTRALAERALDLPAQLPRTDVEATGGRLRDRMLELRTAESERMSQLAAEAGLDNKTWLPFSKLQARIQSITPSRFAEGESMGKVLQTIKDYKMEAGTPVNFQDIKFLREQLGDEIRAAERAGERNKARIMADGRKQIDEFLDNDVPAAVFQGDVGLQGKYKEFRQTYKTDFIDRFEQGAGREAKRVGPDQRYRSADEDVAFDFFKPGDVRAARDFKRVFADDPEAAQAMTATILDSARQASVKDGAVDRRALERWFKAHDNVLAQFPEARAMVQDVGRATEAIEARRATLVQRGRAIEDSRFTQAAGGDPAKAVDALLSDKRMADRAIRVMDDGERSAFSRAMWDFAIGKDGTPSPDTIRGFLKDHGDVARKVMSPEHIRSLRNLADAWEMQGRVPSPAGKMGDSNPLKSIAEAVGSGPLQISSRLFAASSGRTSWRMAMTDLLARAGIATSSKEAERIAREALYDPGFANELAAYVRNPESRMGKQAVPKMKAYVSTVIQKAATPEENDDRR